MISDRTVLLREQAVPYVSCDEKREHDLENGLAVPLHCRPALQSAEGLEPSSGRSGALQLVENAEGRHWLGR